MVTISSFTFVVQVVDSKCKVFGMEGLRLADGSVMPDAVSGAAALLGTLGTGGRGDGFRPVKQVDTHGDWVKPPPNNVYMNIPTA